MTGTDSSGDGDAPAEEVSSPDPTPKKDPAVEKDPVAEKGPTAEKDSGQPRHRARKDKPLPPAAKRKKAGQARAKGAAGPTDPGGAAGRYTAPVPQAKRGPSPRWVPVLMFALWGVGLALILLNYMGLLPGSADGGNGWYLLGGLGLILGGIITATQYR